MIQFQMLLPAVQWRHASFTAVDLRMVMLMFFCRINKVGHLYYGKWEQRFYLIWAYVLVASVIIFGTDTFVCVCLWAFWSPCAASVQSTSCSASSVALPLVALLQQLMRYGTRAGPICGVIAAGLEYGDYKSYGSTYGERLRFAATYVRPLLLYRQVHLA